jgi:hypothetical protein
VIPINNPEPVLIKRTEPLVLAGTVWRARCAPVAPLGTQVKARSFGGPGIVA